MLEEAIKKHRDGDLEGAEKIYRELLEAEPERHDVHHLLAMLANDQGRIEEALDHAERAIEIEPEHAAYHQTLASVLHRQGDLAGARANMERAVELDPNVPEGHNTLGYLQFLTNDLSAAEQTLRIALKLEPDSPRVLTNLGNVYLAQGRAEEARTLFNQALEIEPDSVAARASLGRALLAEGAATFAEECFRRCVEARPESASLQVLLGRAVLANGRSEEARSLFDKVLKDDPNQFEARVGLGDAAASESRYREAVANYQRALLIRRGEPTTVEKLADALMALGDYQAASRCYQALADRGYPAQDLRARLGRSLDALGQTDAAVSALESALKDDPADIDAALALAQVHARAGRREQGLAVLEELPEKERDRSRVRVVRARLNLALARAETAMEVVGEIPEISDYRREALELRGRALDAKEDYPAAAETFAELAAAAETPPPEVRAPAVDMEQAAGWPQEPPDDGRGEPVFITGLPGSGIHAVVEALDRLAKVDIVQDRFGKLDGRRDFLTTSPPPDWDAVDEHNLRMTRRKYWHALRHARRKQEPGVAGIDRLPVSQVDPAAIARYFPKATLLVVCRHPGDHLLHSESFGWRDDCAATIFDLEDFYGHLLDAESALGLKIVWLDFDRLRTGETAALDTFFEALGPSIEGFAGHLTGELKTADGLDRYWPPGHWEHYAEPMDMDRQALDALAERLDLSS